jgi:hypothetical protein
MIGSAEGISRRQAYTRRAVMMALAISTAACATGLRTSPDDYPGMAYERGEHGIVLFDLEPADATARFVVAVYPNNSADYQVEIAAAEIHPRGGHHMLSAGTAVDYARRLRGWLASKEREQIYSGWRAFEEHETRILLSDLPFGDNLVAFHFQIRSRSDGDDSWQYIMHVHQRYIAGMAQALEVGANMVDGAY